MTRFPGIMAMMAISALLIGCDIEPVSVGTWDIEVATDSGMQFSLDHYRRRNHHCGR